MKALIFAILAPACYGLGNVLLEHKLAKYNNLTLMLVYLPVILVFALVARELVKTGDPSYAIPVGNDLWSLIILGFIFFVADYFFIGAYTNGGNLAMITLATTLLFPSSASFFKFIGSKYIPDMVYAPPNGWLLAGYGLAILAVLCIIKGAPASNI